MGGVYEFILVHDWFTTGKHDDCYYPTTALSVTMGITQSKQDGRRQRRLCGRNCGRVSHLWGLLRFSDKTSGFILPWGEVLKFTL